MIDAGIRAHIESWMADVAREERVRILYAAESGSRAWGFGSPDSDYDVRFIYVHERNWYVGLEDERDVIERPLDARLVDLAGWDVRKALRLLLRSNPALYEWLVSPIVYVDDGVLRPAIRQLFERHASQKALAYHYWSIARGQWRREIEGRTEVKLKKYFYVVRPLLSLAWVVEKGTPPPMQIGDLLATASMPSEVRSAIAALIGQKRETPEIGLGPRIAPLDDWASSQLSALSPDGLALSSQPARDGRAAADALYRRVIGMPD